MALTTKDIGLAIRSELDLAWVEGFDFEKETWTGLGTHIDSIDVSAASNPVIHLDNGQVFVVNIIAKG